MCLVDTILISLDFNFSELQIIEPDWRISRILQRNVQFLAPIHLAFVKDSSCTQLFIVLFPFKISRLVLYVFIFMAFINILSPVTCAVCALSRRLTYTFCLFVRDLSMYLFDFFPRRFVCSLCHQLFKVLNTNVTNFNK